MFWYFLNMNCYDNGMLCMEVHMMYIMNFSSGFMRANA